MSVEEKDITFDIVSKTTNSTKRHTITVPVNITEFSKLLDFLKGKDVIPHQDFYAIHGNKKIVNELPSTIFGGKIILLENKK